MTTCELYSLLEKKYGGPAWAYLPECRNQTGYGRKIRTADAIVMSLWPSRGLDIYGFELKVSRSDWLHELKQPAKADAIASYCDFWYLVIGDETIAPVEEIPRTWGLLVAQNKKLVEKKTPERLTPSPLDKPFLAAILRNATRYVMPEEQIRDKLIEAQEQGREEGKISNAYHVKNLEEKVADMIRTNDEFYTASGVRIHNYQGKKIGEAVRIVMDSGKMEDFRRSLAQQMAHYQQLTETIRQQLLVIEKMNTEKGSAP